MTFSYKMEMSKLTDRRRDQKQMVHTRGGAVQYEGQKV